MAKTLERKLGFGDAVFLGIAAMVGVGVFVAFAPATEAAGQWVWVSLLVAAFIAVCNALSSARLAARFPAAGGTYVYGREKLGMAPGFLAGWGFIVGKTASCAAMALTVGLYIYPENPSVVGAVAVLALTVLNVFGVQRSAFVTRVIVIVVLVSLGILFVTAWLHTSTGGGLDAAGSAGDGADAGSTAAENGLGLPAAVFGVLGGAGFLFFAFAGYARLATLGEEVRNPARVLPRAILTATAIVILVYAALLWMALDVLGVEGVAGDDAPLLGVAQTVGGTWLEALIRIVAGVAAIGALLAMILGVSRTTMALARDRHLPAPLARVNSGTSTPYVAEIAVGTVVVAIVLAADVREAIGFSSFAVLVYYAVANASALRLAPEEGRPPRGIPIAGLIGCLVVAFSLPVTSVVSGLVVFALGGLVFLATRRRAVPPGEWSRPRPTSE